MAPRPTHRLLLTLFGDNSSLVVVVVVVVAVVVVGIVLRRFSRLCRHSVSRPHHRWLVDTFFVVFTAKEIIFIVVVGGAFSSAL